MKHVLTNVDPDNDSADCAVCGVVRLKKQTGAQAGTYRCYNLYWHHKNQSRRGNKKVPFEWKLLQLELQDGKCAICKEPMDQSYIDHDHETGEVRGLLCHRCNSGLGFFNDDPQRLLAALEYLR